MKRTLFVDGQVFQTGARDRGMGRYAVCVIQAFQRKSGYAIEVILSSNLPKDPKDEAFLRDAFNNAPFHSLDLRTTEQGAIENAFEHNKKVLDNFFAERNEPFDYFIPSLFQEPTVAVYPENARAKTVLFHDLIPYLYHERYEPVMLYENYLKRFKYIFESDIIFTNSQTVADDLSIYLGIPKQKLQRIDGAAIHTDNSVTKPKHISLDKPFILFNTSDDPRKNNLTTVLGFEEFCKESGSDYNLVLTSNIQEKERARLARYSDRLIFTGNVPESELNWLYENCELLLCTPESEGLGLMVLEAVDARKKVVASSITVFQEISPDAFFYCNHESSYSIAQALRRAVDPKATYSKKAYEAIQSYFSWDRTAERMLQGLDAFKPVPNKPKPKIAVFTARPSGLSGVGLTASVLHPVVAESFQVDYFIEEGLSTLSIRPDYLRYVAPCYPAQSFSIERYRTYDAVFYHMGNGEYHLESIKNSLYLPGYIIVHDTNLKEAFRVLRETSAMSAKRVELEEKLDSLNSTTHSQYYSSIANRQLGILTHSTYAQEGMQEVLDVSVPIVRTNLPTNVPENTVQKSHGKLVIGLAGAIADVKGLAVISSIAEDPAFKHCDIRLFGFNHASKDKLEKLAAYDNVSIATNVSDFDFQTSFSKLDIFINYRMTYKGETSNTTLEAMRQGVVTIVRDIGWFSELDDDVVIKVKSPDEAISAARELINDVDSIAAIGQRARAYVAREFTQQAYVDAMVALISKKSQTVNTKLSRKLKSNAMPSAEALTAAIKEVQA